MKKEGIVDRRIQKTKRSLTEALIQLILEKNYENVTIRDIIDKANVGRSTFYTHYESKEQLLMDGHNNLNVPLFTVENDTTLNFSNMFSHISENVNLAKAMIGKKGGNVMIMFFKNNISLGIKKKYAPSFGRSRAERLLLSYLSDAAAAAVMSLLVSWIEDDMYFSIADMSGRCSKIVIATFKGEGT